MADPQVLEAAAQALLEEAREEPVMPLELPCLVFADDRAGVDTRSRFTELLPRATIISLSEFDALQPTDLQEVLLTQIKVFLRAQERQPNQTN